jgi:hypothetical protein
MSVATLDTHRVVKRLRSVGFTDEQAETVTDVLREAQEAALVDLATKADIAEVKADIEALRAELKNDNAALRTELKNDIAMLRAEMVALEQRMTIKLGGMIAAGVVLVTVLVKIL